MSFKLKSIKKIVYLNIHSQMVGEHSLTAEAVPKGAVDVREERMPV